MGEQCMMRTPPAGAFVPSVLSITQFVMWEPCLEPVVFRQENSYATGGLLLLCKKHEEFMREAQE
jgi:hypothetical protein